MIFHGFSHEKKGIFLYFSHRNQSIERENPIKFHQTVIFLWFSYGFPMVFPGFSPHHLASPAKTQFVQADSSVLWHLCPVDTGDTGANNGKVKSNDFMTKFMGNLWGIYGESMEYLWNIYGISMEYLWRIYG